MTGLLATRTSATLNWSNNPAATSIVVERAGADGVFTPLATVDPLDQTYTDTTVQENGVYQYRIVAYGPGPSVATSNILPIDAALTEVMNEEEINCPGWALGPAMGSGLFEAPTILFAHWNEQQGIWQGHTRFAKQKPHVMGVPGDFQGLPVYAFGQASNRAVAYPQHVQCEMDGSVDVNLTGWSPLGVASFHVDTRPSVWVSGEYTFNPAFYPPGSTVNSDGIGTGAIAFTPPASYFGPAYFEFRVVGTSDGNWTDQSPPERIYIDVVPHLWIDFGSNPKGYISEVGQVIYASPNVGILVGTIRLATAPVGDMDVSITCLYCSVDPPILTIPAGQTSKQFTLYGVDTGSGVGRITAIMPTGPGGVECDYTAEARVFFFRIA